MRRAPLSEGLPAGSTGGEPFPVKQWPLAARQQARGPCLFLLLAIRTSSPRRGCPCASSGTVRRYHQPLVRGRNSAPSEYRLSTSWTAAWKRLSTGYGYARPSTYGWSTASATTRWTPSCCRRHLLRRRVSCSDRAGPRGGWLYRAVVGSGTDLGESSRRVTMSFDCEGRRETRLPDSNAHRVASVHDR